MPIGGVLQWISAYLKQKERKIIWLFVSTFVESGQKISGANDYLPSCQIAQSFPSQNGQRFIHPCLSPSTPGTSVNPKIYIVCYMSVVACGRQHRQWRLLAILRDLSAAVVASDRTVANGKFNHSHSERETSRSGHTRDRNRGVPHHFSHTKRQSETQRCSAKGRTAFAVSLRIAPLGRPLVVATR